MICFEVNGKEYKVQFGYGVLCKTDLLERIGSFGNVHSVQEVVQVLPELLLIGLQKRHSDEFGFESDKEKKVALDKVYDLLDDYEAEGTEENPRNGMILFQEMVAEVERNGFLSGMVALMSEPEQEKQTGKKTPQDHKKKS